MVWADVTTELSASDGEVTLAMLKKKKKGPSQFLLDLYSITLILPGDEQMDLVPTFGEKPQKPAFERRTSLPLAHPSGDLKVDCIACPLMISLRF